MQGTKQRIFVTTLATIGCFFALATQGAAQSPATRTLQCTRNGREIGNETISITRSATGMTVNMKVQLQVKMLGISVYRFDQTSTETWSKDQLDTLTSETSDNGKSHSLRVQRDGSVVNMIADKSTPVITSATLPATLWYEPHFQEATLIHNVDGHSLHVKAQKLNDEKLQIRGGTLDVVHYRLSGDLTDDLWFDADGILVQRRSTANDHSVLQFTMK